MSVLIGECRSVGKRILLIGFLSLVALCVVGGLVLYLQARSVAYETLMAFRQLENRPVGQVHFEEESMVKAQDLQTFYLFSGEKGPYVHWLAEMQANGVLTPIDNLGHMRVLQNFSMLNLRSNDCQRPFCYQHRISFDEIPSSIWKGLMGIEDYRFLSHFGVDLVSIFRALWVDLMEMKIVQGGSTLTQQLVKNLFFTNEKTLTRKLKEMAVAVYLEHHLEKDEIMVAYLNEVFWGSMQNIRIKGIYSASLFYFGKRPLELDDFEIAILVALLKGPSFYGPINHLKNLQERSQIVYQKLTELKLFYYQTKIIWDSARWQKWQKKLISQQQLKDFYSIWEVSRRSVSCLDQFSAFVFSRSAQNLSSHLKKRFPLYDFGVKAVISLRNDQDCTPFWYYSKVERNQANGISGEFHQVGSVLKPIIYRIFREAGFGLDQMVKMDPISLQLPSGTWSPKESRKDFPPEVSLGEALLKSYNRPVIYIAQQMGMAELEKQLLGLIPQLKRPLQHYPAQLLGALELSLEELHKIYQKFVELECQQSENPQNILHFLADPHQTTVQRVVDEYLGQHRFFGKTGTSNRGMDNWFVFFDGRHLGVIWTGVEGMRPPIANLPIGGSSTSFRIFQDFLRDQGKRIADFYCWENS